MVTAAKVIAEAESWDGYCEKKNASNLGDKTDAGKIVNAGDNNYTIFGKHLLDVTGAKDVYGINYQWCDQFCDDTLLRVCINEYGTLEGTKKCYAMLGGWSAYTPTSAGYYQKKGRWSKTPKVGAQIFFKNSTRIHHTGWVRKFDASRVYTVEGNTNSGPYVVANGGQVRLKSYVLTDPCIAGYGMPDYGSETLLGWVKNGQDYYYRVSDGVNAHGFKDIKSGDGNTYRYYFDASGKMLTGWQLIDNKWYFFHDTVGSGREGAMYVTDKNGVQTIGIF
jgi:hypothetical protein